MLQWHTVVKVVLNLQVTKSRGFLDLRSNYKLFKKEFLHCNCVVTDSLHSGFGFDCVSHLIALFLFPRRRITANDPISRSVDVNVHFK